MSGIAGIYNLDGRPVDPELLRRMTGAIAHRGPDGEGHWTSGAVGLGQRMLHTTPESLRERQPLLDETGNLCLVLDGRVDNREELKEALESRGARLRDDTDAELVLRSYEVWGEESPAKIIGDFAFAVWDGRKHQLFCARDILGVKPFYYHYSRSIFLLGSDLRSLLDSLIPKRELNENMVGEYLACSINDREETLYKDIFRLMPASFLVINSENVRKKKYWDINPQKRIQYRADDEYGDHFADLLKESVKCRLRTITPIGAELSGGIDSSSVVALIQSFIDKGMLTDTELSVFSAVFPGLACDESDYIKEVETKWGIKTNPILPGKHDRLKYTEQIRRTLDFPDFPNSVMMYPLMESAQNKGIRVIMTGGGGDDFLTGSKYHYADLLRQFKILRLIRQIRCDRQFAKSDNKVPAISFPSHPILKLAFWPLMPDFVRQVYRRVRGHVRPPQWVNANFALKTNLAERVRQNSANGRQFSSVVQKDLYCGLNNGWLSQGNERSAEAESRFHLERRHAFYDRRIIEFAFAIPEEQRWRYSQPKFVVRKAMRDYLPETVRTRLTKADFSHVLVEALLSLYGRSLSGPLSIGSLGWVNESEIIRMYKQMIELYENNNMGYISIVWRLWMVLGMELWFNTVFNSQQEEPHLESAYSFA